MKKINWTEIALAAPMALAFGNLGGARIIVTVTLTLGFLMVIAKLAEIKKPVPVAVRTNQSRG